MCRYLLRSCICSCDLDLYQTTLIYELALDILKIYVHTKTFSGEDFQKLMQERDRQTQLNALPAHLRLDKLTVNHGDIQWSMVNLRVHRQRLQFTQTIV